MTTSSLMPLFAPLTPVAAVAAGAAATLLGESFSSVAHMLLAEVSVVWPITVGAGKQPALYKPYLSALVKVGLLTNLQMLRTFRWRS